MIDAARLRISLQDIEPAPWREVEVPLSMTFKGLHDTIQAAFLWFDSHLWQFDIGDKRYGIPFDDEGWGGTKVYKAANAKLTKLRDASIESFLYTYDIGDNWEHRIDVISLFEAESSSRLPRFMGGEHKTPPEDIGGPPGYELFLEAIHNPSHPDHDHFNDWYNQPFDQKDIEEEIIRIQFSRLSRKRPKK